MTPEHFRVIARLLRDRSGLVLSEERAYLLENRLLPVARKWKQRGPADVIRTIVEKGDEALLRDVIEAMTTNETSFFRDREVFAHFRDHALPAMLAARARGRVVRIWSAACSTGQEPYSLAMLLADLGPEFAGWRFEIIATDISTESLARAREGGYSQFEVQRGLPIRLLLRNFEQNGERWFIQPRLRGTVMFRNFNLLSDPTPLGRFDIVLCRNVLVYFDNDTKSRVLERIARRMPEDGLLYLGADEAVAGLTDRFRPVADYPGVFAPKVDVRVLAPDALGLRQAVSAA
jgi:chemotaxis protein methyltransferase CheR